MVDLAGLEVQGISVGGVETCIEVPEYKLAFDIGRCPPSAIMRTTILFTHAHLDHMGGVASHTATRALRNMPPPTYVVPHENVAAFRELFAVWRKLDSANLPFQLVALGPGESHRLPNGMFARAFRSPHSAPCQGYGIFSVRQKLRPELAHLAGDDLRARREAGESITDPIEVCELAFCGDTLIDVIDREEIPRTARRLILESTFLDERVTPSEARSKGHVHLDEIIQRADRFENEAILLTHFSARYRAREVTAVLDAKLPPLLKDRVQALLTGF